MKQEKGKKGRRLCNLKKKRKDEEIKQMKSFLHSGAPGCSVGVAFPKHEQLHWLLSLLMSLFFLCNLLPTESPCLSSNLTDLKKKRHIPGVSVLHSDRSTVGILSVHGASNVRFHDDVDFFWRYHVSLVC